MTPIVIEVHLLDIPEVQAAIAAAVETGIRQASSPIQREWITRVEFSQLIGLSVGTCYNQPWRFPPIKKGPTKVLCIKREDAIEWMTLSESEQKHRWGRTLADRKL